MRALSSIVVVALAACGPAEVAHSPAGDPVRAGDPHATGDTAHVGDIGGDPITGDNEVGDPATGDAIAGDTTTTGDAIAGDTTTTGDAITTANCHEGSWQELPCNITNGTGIQWQQCAANAWIDDGGCTILACDTDFHPEAGACVAWDPATVYEIAPSVTLANLLEVDVHALAGSTGALAIVSVDKGGDIVATPDHVAVDSATGMFSWTPRPSQVDEYTVVIDVAGTEITIHVVVTMPAICTESGTACTFLQTQWDADLACGHVGDWYHNCDGFHTNLNMGHFPQLDRIESSGCYTETGTYADRVVIGNESCAITSGANWSSIGRNLLRSNFWAGRINTQYENNAFYWYPEHRDHDDSDYYHGQIPFMNFSQGSSGSEMDEVRNWVYILAAFRPDVKRRLVRERLLMPTAQMVFRRARVADDATYLTAAAHPSVFDNLSARQEMVELANAITVDAVPPKTVVSVIDETYTVVGGKQEQWFDTPVSICRIFRGTEYTKTMTVSAEGSWDANLRPLTYHWVVLRGDPAHVRVAPQGNGSVASIEIDYHPNTTIEGDTRLTNRVTIGVFVHNGAYYSAPAFISSYTLDNEERTYDTDGTLLDLTTNANYVYPYLL